MAQSIKTFGDLKEGDTIYRVYWYDVGYFDMTVHPDAGTITKITPVENGDNLLTIEFTCYGDSYSIVVIKENDESWDGDSLQFLSDKQLVLKLIDERLEMSKSELDAIQGRIDELTQFRDDIAGGVNE